MSAPVQAYHHPIVLRADYETPEPLFQRYHAIHRFTLDAAASPHNAKCARFFTPEIDGLAQDWGSERVWLNPPYGREIGAWMRKASESAALGALVVALIPSRTDSGWWHDYVEPAEYEHLRGRVKFVGMEHNAPFPCSVVTFRLAPLLDEVQRLRKERYALAIALLPVSPHEPLQLDPMSVPIIVALRDRVMAEFRDAPQGAALSR